MKARDNPFRTDRILQVRYHLGQQGWTELLQKLERLRFRAAIIGPHGSGKTTLLEDLEPIIRRRGFETVSLCLNEEHSSFEPNYFRTFCAALSCRQVILFDGAEQLRPWAWRWFTWQTRHAGGLVITSHRAGRLPTLWQCSTSPDLLAGIAAQLLDRRAPTLVPEADRLFTKHGGNIRHALREWYDLIAAAEG